MCPCGRALLDQQSLKTTGWHRHQRFPWQRLAINNQFNDLLVGGFNPFEKYLSKWKSSPNRGEHKKYCRSIPDPAS